MDRHDVPITLTMVYRLLLAYYLSRPADRLVISVLTVSCSSSDVKPRSRRICAAGLSSARTPEWGRTSRVPSGVVLVSGLPGSGANTFAQARAAVVSAA